MGVVPSWFTATARPPNTTCHGLRVAGISSSTIADIFGHSPDMLMNTDAHAMPAGTTAVINAISQRGS